MRSEAADLLQINGDAVEVTGDGRNVLYGGGPILGTGNAGTGHKAEYNWR